MAEEFKQQDEIRLFSGDSGIPVEVCHSKITKPSSDKFNFVPKNFPQLNKSVLSMTWNSSKKTIVVEIEETIEYDVIRWMEYLVNEHLSSQKSPFVDIDTNNLQIVFHDTKGHATGNLRLKNIKLENHVVNCGKDSMYTTFGLDSPETDQTMIHTVELSYQHSEFTKSPDNSRSFIDVNQLEDNSLEEWQKVELMPTD